MNSREESRMRLLADAGNRAILTVLDDAGQPLHVNDLAERLVRRSEAVLESSEYERRFEQQRLSLHHGNLPRLAEAGLVDYDRDTNTVTPRNDTGNEIDWTDGATIDEVAARFHGERRADGSSIGTIEGRRSVIEYGRELADEAEEELFCMYVSTDLLEDECIRRAEDAIDRGVEVYVGSRNPDVRDLTRRHLPEATIWEPQRGWMTAPSSYPKVGRLVLVDRRKVMLALLAEPEPDGTYPRENATVGRGDDNPLVVLVRELLGPRLDHLDYQSADFRSGLPS